MLYENGEGVEQDYSLARRYYQLSADHGDLTAQKRLANLYDSGRGGEQSAEQAVYYWKLAADQGDSDAQYHLGLSYEFGDGAEQDYTQAALYYQMAARQGNEGAKESLQTLNSKTLLQGKSLTPDVPILTDGVKLQGPFVITTCGQTSAPIMFNMVARYEGHISSYSNVLTANEFDPTEVKTLVVTTGTSADEMNAVGTGIDEEIERCVKLIEKAREAGTMICCAHIEGMPFRTGPFDQKSIDTIISLADVVLVVDDSDRDGFFTDYCSEHNITMLKVIDSLHIGDVLE